jgi:GT2 family glycosyltransferase
MAHPDLVSVTVVTYNSGRFIKRCLESVLAQKYSNLEVVVVDNHSTDGTIDILEQFEDRCRILYNEENTGFAGAQNQAIQISRGEWVLTLNPDVLLLPNFIAQLVEAGYVHPRIGAVCGKLLTINATFDLPDKPRVDSTGIYFTPMLRHLDRGSQEVDNGEYSSSSMSTSSSTAKMRMSLGGLSYSVGAVSTRPTPAPITSATSCPATAAPCLRKSICTR